jgi:hypothetical protein
LRARHPAEITQALIPCTEKGFQNDGPEPEAMLRQGRHVIEPDAPSSQADQDFQVGCFRVGVFPDLLESHLRRPSELQPQTSRTASSIVLSTVLALRSFGSRGSRPNCFGPRVVIQRAAPRPPFGDRATLTGLAAGAAQFSDLHC